MNVGRDDGDAFTILRGLTGLRLLHRPRLFYLALALVSPLAVSRPKRRVLFEHVVAWLHDLSRIQLGHSRLGSGSVKIRQGQSDQKAFLLVLLVRGILPSFRTLLLVLFSVAHQLHLDQVGVPASSPDAFSSLQNPVDTSEPRIVQPRLGFTGSLGSKREDAGSLQGFSISRFRQQMHVFSLGMQFFLLLVPQALGNANDPYHEDSHGKAYDAALIGNLGGQLFSSFPLVVINFALPLLGQRVLFGLVPRALRGPRYA